MENPLNFFTTLVSSENIGIFSDIRIFFAVGIALFLVLIIFAVGKRSSGGLNTQDRERISRAWREVTKDIQHHESHWRNAIIRADAVLDLALRTRRFSGETMAQRMNRAARKYPAVEDAFKAHRLRNELAHNPMRGITEKETRWALQIFERALRSLGM
ncbi:MAG: hypothetical protein AAB448_02000 [Patescibacteria group bacterium]